MSDSIEYKICHREDCGFFAIWTIRADGTIAIAKTKGQEAAEEFWSNEFQPEWVFKRCPLCQNFNGFDGFKPI
ncbi:MAG: hypothetical protein JRD68_00055 [Deltaproteobacteria bacterium]|nr:hypothetical protein [Deltaproteobacteria bacterium]